MAAARKQEVFLTAVFEKEEEEEVGQELRTNTEEGEGGMGSYPHSLPFSSHLCLQAAK